MKLTDEEVADMTTRSHARAILWLKKRIEALEK